MREVVYWMPRGVRQGDYLTKLAHLLGFDPEMVWNHPKNAKLRNERRCREILSPGDIIWFPEVSPRTFELRIGQENVFVVDVPEVRIEILLRDQERHPLAGKQYSVEGLGEPLLGYTDGEGRVALSVPVDVTEVELVLEGDLHYRVLIGTMDPVEEGTGVIKRLGHLGYLGTDQPDDTQMRCALSAFQVDHGLPGTGKADNETREALVEAHKS